MVRKNYYKYLFLLAALWNCSAGLISAIIYKPFFLYFGMAVPASPVWLHAFLGAVFTLGLGLYLVSRDISKNHAVVQIEVFGKILVFLYFVYYFITGELSYVIVLMGLVDFIYAILFIEFLINFKKVNE